MWFKETVSHKKKLLSSLLKAPIEQVARLCARHWDQPENLNRTLQQNLSKLPYCQLLYVVDAHGRQLSANITRTGIDNTWHGQDLSARPFLQGILPFQGMTLSAAYLSQRSMQPCITALQAVRDDDRLLGFIAADFHLKDLPNMSGTSLQRMQLICQDTDQLQHRQQPAQRQSTADQHIDYLIYVLSTLMQEHGIFHCKLDFVSAYVCLWPLQDPFDYQIHNVEQLLEPSLFQRYPKRGYDIPTRLELERVPLVFAQLKALRLTDDTDYLRSGSVNMINARIGLNLTSDGTQYMNADDFLNHDLSYWLDQDYRLEQISKPATPN